MKSVTTGGLKLLLVCGVAAVSLGLVNEITEPVIRERREQELRAALQELAGGNPVGDSVSVAEEPGVRGYYRVSGGEPPSRILELVGTGYGGDMKLLARVADDGTILACKLMENSETPGLGKKAETPGYMDKFLGLGASGSPIPTRKNMLDSSEADAVTGASITFGGIGRALEEAAAFARALEGGGP